jgi:predicted RecB family nuclease
MATKITSDVLESYLRCKFKGSLKLAGQQGTKGDFEAMLAELRAEVRLKAIDTIMARHPGDQVARNIPLTIAGLKRGPQYILDGTLEDDALALQFDGLKRMEGASKFGDFHYVPVLFHESRQIKKEQRLLLEVYGMLLSGLQGRAPAHGIVWHGQECKATRVKLNPDHRKAEQVLRGLENMATSGSSPRLLLNDHCPVCEFCQRCREQAVQEDNLSLLRGLKEKEVQAYARKGLLTVTQLAHTFRPRRKGKKARHKDRHSYPLQALAIRDKKTYVLGSLQLPDAPARVYLDLEGKSEESLVYLIGVIVTTGGSEVRYSFWADDREQETEIFEQFLELVRPFDDFRVFCYGSYELAFLRRMRKHARNKQFAERVLKNTVNVLSVIYSHVHFPVTSNGLKEVGRHLGCSWTDPDASGLQSLVWRTRWEQTLDERLKQQLTTYNLEDCLALKRITEVLFWVAAHAGSGGQPTPRGPEGMPVPDVQDANRLAFPAGWGPITFFHPDFAYLNRCSYFDYQRQRVYVRTSKVLRMARSSCGKRINRKLRASKCIVIEGRSCPHCKSKTIVQIPRSSHEIKDPRRKRAFDLVFTPAGVRAYPVNPIRL